MDESADFIPVMDHKVYHVIHHTNRPIARVLLAGPFASERPHSYSAWVGWARFLARNGFEAIRFDYRGVGESTGNFEDFSFRNWADDVALVAHWVEQRQPSDVPILLHGLGLGALLAAEVFSQGTGRALLLWATPSDAREVLHESLSRRIRMDFVVQPRGAAKALQDYVAMMESGGTIEVEGYRWTQKLWRGAEGFHLSSLLGSAEQSGENGVRPWKSIRLERSQAPLVSGIGSSQALNPRAIVGRVPLNPDFSEFFRENVAWFRSILTASSGTTP